MMDSPFFWIAAVIFIILGPVVIARWIFRINTIVELMRENNLLLKNIAGGVKCDGCGGKFPTDKIMIIDSGLPPRLPTRVGAAGQNLCPACFDLLRQAPHDEKV